MPTALVTGGCSGIGLAIAGQLATRGYDLVLVSERGVPLADAAAGLRATHRISAHPLTVNLARPDAAEEVHHAVRERGLEIDVLVNNAGMFFFGEAVDAHPARANALLQLHVVTPSLLCTRFGLDMRERRRGHILILSSISAARDFPGISYYGSSKKYLRGFARALRSELGIYGVNVTCLLPGATATALYDSTGQRPPGPPARCDDVARGGGRGGRARDVRRRSGVRSRPGHPRHGAGGDAHAADVHRPHSRARAVAAASVTDPFTPFRLNGLTLRNRIVKAATFEGMCPGGSPSDALVEHHRAIAAGGAAMTTVAYCAISPDGRSYATQLLMRPEIVPALRRLVDAVHREGAAASIQLGHCGYFADPRVIGGRPLGASRVFNTYGLSFARPMTEADLARVIADFASSARLAIEAGFDAIELHFGHGYLVSQFLSPFTNRRRDRWGGLLDNRMRLAVEVTRAVRGIVGARVPLLAKINLRDGFPGGLDLDEALVVAQSLETEGLDALVTSGGFVSRTPLYMLRGEVPISQMVAVQERLVTKVGLFLFGRLFVQRYPYEEAFFLEDARRLRAAVRLPLMLLGGIKTRASIERALGDGFELVGMARALLHDATLPRRLMTREVDASACIPCNECIAEMDRGGVRCVRAGSSHEKQMAVCRSSNT